MSRFLNALTSRNCDRPPVWIMRQAGRHLASYRALRSQYSFLEMCHEPELIARVTRLPLERYGMDAAILFSDILVIPEAMGVGLHFEDKKGPIIEHPITCRRDVEALPLPDMEKLRYVAQGIDLLKPALNIPLIGFCGAPFTVASYMIEGGSSRDLKKTKQWLYRDPDSFHLLLDKITAWSEAYLRLQVEAGVKALQLFESWFPFLSVDGARSFSFPYLKRLLKANVPTILFAKGAALVEERAALGASALGLDWQNDLPAVRKKTNIALQGNLDPDLLYASLPTIKKEVEALLDSMKGDKSFIMNLGHGLPPDVSEEAVETFVNTVQQWRG